MPRSSAQSDFVIQAAPEVFEVELPPETNAVSLPKATWRTNMASARATKWVLAFVFLTLLLLLVLTVVGPHIPGGE